MDIVFCSIIDYNSLISRYRFLRNFLLYCIRTQEGGAGISEPKLKFVLMSFDKGTGLSEHAAPGEALIFALDGEGVIGYEDREHPIKAGENFKFAKVGLHSVKATERFKMALLLTLE